MVLENKDVEMKKAELIFDVGGVLILLDNRLMPERLRLLMKIPPSAGRLLQDVRSSGIGTGIKSVKDLYESFKNKYGLDADYGDFLMAWSVNHREAKRL